MNIKRYIFLVLIFLVLISLSAVSAADDDVSDIISANENEEIILDETIDEDVSSVNDNEEIILEDENSNNLVGSENDNPSLKDGQTGSFTDLHNLINVDWVGNNTISLDCDYNFTSADSGFACGINITRELTIDGQSHTIDGNKGARIFHVFDGADVKFLNINFINGNALVDSRIKDGGAINTETSNCVAENCSFSGNTADNGGAMYRGTANNCIFTSNKADNSGGAMYEGTANDCNFTGNSAYQEGGAMYRGTANDCIFTSNNVNRNDGGGMMNGTANNCMFINNTAHDEGGALYKGTANNCTFTGNSGNCGGGMMYGTANNCTFYTNFVDDTGDAIMDAVAKNCTFILIFRNKASTIDGTQCDGNCRFIVADINVSDFITFLHSNETLQFKLTATVDDKELVFDGIRTGIKLSKDQEDMGTYYANSGEGWKVDLEPGTYTAQFIVEESQVEPVTATIKVSDGTTFWDLNRDINGNDANEVTLNKSYKFNPEVDSDFVNGCNINREVTIDGNNHTIDADGKARIFNIPGYDAILKNINLINASAPSVMFGGSSGGAIFTEKSCYLENCNFANNAAYSGGAICCYGDCTAINCSFTNNYKYSYSSGNGGAILCDNAIIENCSFIGNTANHGGAIYSSLTCTVVNSNFADNKRTYGGAIYTYNCSAVNCNFTDNQGDIGGAIYTIDDCYVSDSIFMNNNASLGVGGGAIWSLKSFKIENSIFINNSAPNGYGGAISTRDSIGMVFNCTFINNSAKKGDAIYVEDYEIIVSSCSFINNTGNITIYFYCTEDRDLIFNNNTFLNNDNNYTFLLSNKGILNVDYNWFGNNATNYTDKPDGLCNNWLFLNATADPEVVASSDKSAIKFSLYLYNPSSEEVSDYDNTPFENINLTLTATNGNVNDVAKLGESIEFTPANVGIASVTATIENVDDTIELNIKSIPDFSIEDMVYDYGETPSLAHILSDGATGTIIYYLDDGTFLGELDVSENLTLPILGFGSYVLFANYTGDGTFFNASATATLTVNKLKTEIIPSNSSINLFVGDSSKVGYALNPSDAVGEITFTSSNPEVLSIDSAGAIKALADGSAVININFAGNTNYLPSNATVNVSVSKKGTALTASSVTTTYNVAKNLVITLKDSKGNPISGATVTVNLNAAKKYTTNKNGQVKVAVGKLVPKTYTAKISFAGDSNYKGSSITAKVTVKKATPKLTARAKTFKFEDKTKKYTITLKDNKNKVMKNKKVTLKVNGKTYAVKTNSKGVATFKLSKLTKKGKYTAAITYNGDKYYKKVTKKLKVTVKASAWKTVSRGSKDKTTVKKIQRALKDNGYYLTYKGHYLKIDGIYGSCTERSVKQFQKAKKLKVTGKVDEKTAKKLKLI